jgi:peptide/nickel transport system permease protein
MNQTGIPLAPPASGWRTFWRLLKYTLLKALKLVILLFIGIYLAVVVLNLGGFVDQISRANIDSANIGLSLSMAQEHKSPEEIREATSAQTVMLTEAYGLNRPFLLRCLEWTIKGLTFNWGEARTAEAFTGQPGQRWLVSQIIKERLALTLVLSGFANLLVFVSSIFVALNLARNYGSRKDRLFSLLSLVSAVPSWVYGLVLVIIFSRALKWLPSGGFLDILTGYSDRDRVQLFLTENGVFDTILNFGKHLILPVTAIFLALFFQSVYTWRIYFQLQANEDYMDLARAKGLSDRRLERNYLLRPALPAIITSFALILVTFWESSIALEYFFGYPGIGNLFIYAVHQMDRGLSLGIVIVFAFLLAATVFVLDFIYVLVDPRLRLGFDAATLRPVKPRRRGWAYRNLAKSLHTDLRYAPSQGFKQSRLTNPFADLNLRQTLGDWLHQARGFSQELFRYTSAKIGLALILLVVALSIYTVIAIPYEASVRLFRTERSEKYQLPETAQPAWTNFFRRNKLPDTRIYSSDDPETRKSLEVVKGDTQMFSYTITIDYPYQDFPQDVVVRFEANDQTKLPFISKMVWVRPDDSQIDFGRFSTATRAYSFSQMESAKNDTFVGGKGGTPPMKTLFLSPEDLEALDDAEKKADPGAETPVFHALPGKYQLQLEGYTFEKDASLGVELVLLGKVYGLAGTDDQRRDLSALLFWGAPITLTFGLLGAVGTTLASMLLAAAGVWKGGWLDETIQRITDLKIILPTLPFAIMIYFLYSKSVWVILGVIILLSIFGAGLKSYRAAFMQIKESPYIEAAKAYGTPNYRIITRYLVPRILPLMIPQIVLLVPTYVFLEATLAFMGVSDLLLPTWGRIMLEALVNGALEGHYYWALEPAVLLVITSAGFALLGFALDKVLNPRLRTS